MIKKTYPQEYYKKLENIASLIHEYRINNGYSQMELAECKRELTMYKKWQIRMYEK